jgi:TRAP-type C4-dicarboxylate transport system substrate-binding protein
MRIMCVSKVSAGLLKLLGASPIEANIQDLYMSLQRGMGDGLIFADAPMRSLKLIEIIENHTLGKFYVAPNIFAMNLKKWESLPPDIQRIFEELTLSAGCLGGSTLTNESEWVIEELRKRGDTFYSLPPEEKARWIKAAQPLYDDWIADLNSRGWDGQEIYKKVMQLQEETRNNPYEPDDWWGRAGKMN